MPFVDVIIVIILGGFVLTGFFFGFVQSLGNLIGTAVGIAAANVFVGPVSTAIGSWFGVNSGMVSIFVFIVLFVLIARLIGLGFWMLAKIFGFLKWIPFARSINHLLGGVLGFIEGALVIGVVFYYASKYVPASTMNAWLAASTIGKEFLSITTAVEALLPAFLQAKK